MRNLFKKLVITSACISMAVTAFLANNSMTTPVTVQAAEKSGLYHEGSSWNYYKDGTIATGTTTLVKYNNSWWYVKDGKIDFSATTLVKFNGKWFYVRNGKVDFSTTTVFKKDGVWWYIHNGEVDFSARTLCKYNGTWWYINNGRIDWNAETVVKYGNTWYYVNHGKVNWNAYGLCKYNGVWWYIDGGRINFKDRTLVKYNGTWWFVHDGKVDFYCHTLCKYNGIWWHIRDGKIDWNSKERMKYGGTEYYCRNGKVDWSYNKERDEDNYKAYPYYVAVNKAINKYDIRYSYKLLNDGWMKWADNTMDGIGDTDELDAYDGKNKEAAKYMLAGGLLEQICYDEMYKEPVGMVYDTCGEDGKYNDWQYYYYDSVRGIYYAFEYDPDNIGKTFVSTMGEYQKIYVDKNGKRTGKVLKYDEWMKDPSY